MNKIITIYKSDMKTIMRNRAVAIIMIGLIILPSLYAWFNIKASWDPYGNTNGIKVAVVNEDMGVILNEEKINLGDRIIEELKSNTQLGWNFVDSNEANKGVNSGKYYASITIPTNFSQDMSSILSGDIKKGELIYTVNEKINAISPKITDKGASSLADTINKTVVETVSGVVLDAFNTIGGELENKLPLLQSLEMTLKDLQGKFNSIDTVVNNAETVTSDVRDAIKSVQGDMGKIKTILESTDELTATLNESATQLQNWSKEISPIIKNDLDMMLSISNSITDLSNGLNNIGSASKDEALKLLDSIELKLNALKDLNNSLIKLLKTIDFVKPGTDLSPIITQLKSINSSIDSQLININKAKETLNNGGVIAGDLLNNITSVSKDISTILTSIVNSYDSKIVPAIEKVFTEIITITTNTNDIVKNAQNNLPKVDEIMNLTLDGLDKGEKGLVAVKENLPKIYSFVNTLVDKLDKVNSSKEVAEILKLLQQNPILGKDFLSQPVKITEDKLFPIPNYGSAMTPFYTVLSLWVGVLILMSILSTEKHGEYTGSQIYFGKLLTFLTLTTLQALLVSLGDIFLLKIYVINPISFVLLNILISTSFTLIVYSLVSVFGNVGKAIGVILLVLQVAGSGGTFPIEVTPKFFQVLNPFLPFTYGISALRETVGGIYMPNLTRDIVLIVIFGIVFMLFALFLKNPINKLGKKFRDSFNNSGLGAH